MFKLESLSTRGLTYCHNMDLNAGHLCCCAVFHYSFTSQCVSSVSVTTTSIFPAPLFFGLNPELWSAVFQSSYSALYSCYSKIYFLPAQSTILLYFSNCLFQILILQRSSVLRPDSRSLSRENSLLWWPGTPRLLQILLINYLSMSLLSFASLPCSV